MKRLFSLIIAMLLITCHVSPALSADGSPFSDVKEKRWSYDSILFAYDNGLMDGVGGGRFDPAGSMTRGMVVTVLYRMEGKPEVEFRNVFSDVKAGKYYSGAVIWAHGSGIVNGISEGIFSPGGKITREQLSAMLYRYAEFKGYDVTAEGDLTKFPDAGDTHSYAKVALTWATAAGIIGGVKAGDAVLLDPRGKATREQFATILARFIPKYEGDDGLPVDPLYEKAEALSNADVCEVHGAALHAVFGPPDSLKESEIGACIVESLGLDRTVYEFRLEDGCFADLAAAYSKIRNGDGTLIPISFEINNTRTVGEPAKIDSLPLLAVRNDNYSSAHAIGCGECVEDEMLAKKVEEFDSLDLCGRHGCVHIEADSLTETGLGDATCSAMGLDREKYDVAFDHSSFDSLAADLDALPVGSTTDKAVTFSIRNKDGAYGGPGEEVAAMISVMKTAEHGCRSVGCPFERAKKAFELFERKYICGEHGSAHITLNHETPSLSEITDLMRESLDLGDGYEVAVDPGLFAAGKISVTARHAKGYETDGLTFTAVYAVDESSGSPAVFTLCENDRDAYKLIVHDGYDGNTGYGGWNYGQTESGWIIDTRGDDGVRHGVINDVSTTESSQVIREINNTVKGVVEHRCSVTMVSGFDGAILDFRNADGDSVCRLQTTDGVWKILRRDGTFETVFDPQGGSYFIFDLQIDLYGETVRVVINDENCGTYPLAAGGVNANIQNFRFASTEEDTVTFSLGLCETFVNYSLFENFSDQYLFGALPAGWTYEGAAVVPNDGVDTSDNKKFDCHLSVDGYAEKTFEPTDGLVTAQFALLPPSSGCNTEYVILGGGDELLRVTADDGSFYVNGERAYDYLKNVWYYFYLVCDTETGDVVFNVNGVDRGSYSLLETGVPLDCVRFENSGAPALCDEFYVFRNVSHRDYVPEPVIPAGEEEYTVGINVCSMWQNGFHAGWACITPFDDTRPVLGYYDEGTPETADWEIKYLLEHGVDFQSFVLYALEEDAPITGALGVHLCDGFKHAKYSDMTKYSLIWCSATAQSPKDLDAWKTYFVPYFIEHHFRDPRYLVIDNKPVMFFFRFVSDEYGEYWTKERRKEAFDYLEEQVKLLGFDGVLLIDSDDTARQTHSFEGFDGVYSYHHGQDGVRFETTRSRIEELNGQSNAWGLTYVPTVSTGFNRIGWLQPRTPVMTVEEYAETNRWVRDEFLPADPSRPDWAKNLVIISNWNEYGEGTYVMPCEEHVGFGYLDVLRETYTSESADESLNTIPTPAQLERIDRLYPQHQILLRAGEYETYSNGVSLVDVPKSGLDTEWIARIAPSAAVVGRDGNVTVSGNVISNDSTSVGKVTISLDCGVDLSLCNSIDVLAYMEDGSRCLARYGAGDHAQMNNLANGTFDGSGEKKYFWIDISECDKAGNVIQLRMPPGMKIYDVRVSCSTLGMFGDRLAVFGNEVPVKVLPELSPRGDYLFGFDTVFTDLHLFGMFVRWDDAAGRLTVSLPGGEFVFTAGSAFYTLNGEEKFLGYEIYLKDGVPMIPLNLITEQAGLTIDFTDIRNAVVTY